MSNKSGFESLKQQTNDQLKNNIESNKKIEHLLKTNAELNGNDIAKQLKGVGLTDVTAEDLLPPVLNLTPRAIFGVNGKVEFGLHLHPDGIHMIYPLGNKVAILNTLNNRQEFISGHINTITCLDISRSGEYIASGQISISGFRSNVILWNFAERKRIAEYELHKELVQSVCFTVRDRFLISIGGRDDDTVIVFDIDARLPICRSSISSALSGKATQVRALTNNPNYFICAGDHHLRLWCIQREQRKLHVQDIVMGRYQRRFTCISIDRYDQHLFLGTMTGDIIKVRLKCAEIENMDKPGFASVMIGAFGTHNPRKPFGKDCNRFANGVRAVQIIDEDYPTVLLIGAGDGTVELIGERPNVTLDTFKEYPAPTWPLYRTLKKVQVHGAVTSIVQVNPLECFIGSDSNEIYKLNVKNFKLKLLMTCHKKTVYNIIFPRNLSTVFATAGHETIRIWSTVRLQELLRVIVYNFDCAGIVFSYDGTSLHSAWNDGVVRAFTPITGRLIYMLPNAHNKGCTAIAINTSGRLLATGGVEGQLRLWKIQPFRQSLVAVLKDHSGPITAIDFSPMGTEIVSASTDGFYVIWDINRLTRRIVITSNTQFLCAVYNPTGVHLLTGGSDGHVSYWMVYDGSLIRELDVAKNASVNGIAIGPNGNCFATAGSDQIVKIWDYKTGAVVCQGVEHASAVKSVAYSPCGKFLVSGATDGSVIIWDIPEKYRLKSCPTFKPNGVTSKPNYDVASKISTNSNRSFKKEYIDSLVANTKRGDICCVECPPLAFKTKSKSKLKK